MKQRFVTTDSQISSRNLLVSIIIFIMVFCLFWFGITAMSEKNSSQERQTLETAINRGIVHCYSIEGTYPGNLQYLEDHYGLTYNKERFFVDYQVLGSNIMPDVTIIDKEAHQ